MYSFIILHYKNIDETTVCLEELEKFANEDIHIIVVDNNTLTSKDEKILKKYPVDILKLDKNYGFAKANNKGIKYAKRKYNDKYYIVMNNDVYIHDNCFLKIINNDYHKYNFDMLGPYIYSPSGESVNPFPTFKTEKEVTNEIKKSNKLIKIYKSRLLYFLLKNYLKIKHIFIKPNIPKNGSHLEKKAPLHGCCIIFSKKYVKKYEYPFYNDTFLFHEEEFLHQRVLKDNLISIYDPNLKVFHKEGSSIKKTNKGERNSKIFKEREKVKSLNLLLKVINNEK